MEFMRKLSVFVVILCITGVLYAQAAREAMGMARGSRSDEPQDIMEALLLIEEHTGIHEEAFAQRLAAEQRKLQESFQPAFSQLKQLEPEIWETDDEFALRLEENRQEIQQQLDAELTAITRKKQEEFSRLMLPYRIWEEAASENIAQVRKIPSEYLQLDPQEYLRNDRIWPILLTSTYPVLPFEKLELHVDLGAVAQIEDRDMRQEIVSMNTGVQSGVLEVDVYWMLARSERDGAVEADILNIVFSNPVNDISYLAEFGREPKREPAAVQIEPPTDPDEEVAPIIPVAEEPVPEPAEKPVYIIQADVVQIELRDGSGLQFPMISAPAAEEEVIIPPPEREIRVLQAVPVEADRDTVRGVVAEDTEEEVPAEPDPDQIIQIPDQIIQTHDQIITLDFTLGVQFDRVSQRAQVMSILRPAVRSHEYSLGLRFVILRDQSNGGEDALDSRHALFSLIDYMHFGLAEDTFRFSAGHNDPFTLGHGMLISKLDPLAEMPFIRRIPVLLEVHTTHFDTTLFIDDLSYPSLLGTRFALGNFVHIPIEIGIGAVVDFGISKQEYPDYADNVYEKTAVAPYIDFRYRFNEEGSDFIEAILDTSFLMLLDQDLAPIVDSFFTWEEGLYNFSASAGIQGTAQALSYRVLGSVSRGLFTPGLFKGMHYTKRGDLIASLFHDDGIGNTDFSFGLHLNADIHQEPFVFSAYSHIPFPETAEGLLGVKLAYLRFPVRLTIGIEGEPADIFGSTAQVYARGTIQAGSSEFSAVATGTPNELQAFSLESTVRLASFPEFVTERISDPPFTPGLAVGFSQGIVSDQETDTLYGVSSLNPSIHSELFDLGLAFRVIYSGDPLDDKNLFDLRRSEGAWTFGAGKEGFSRSMDIAYDLLSFVDYIRIGRPESTIHVSSKGDRPFTLGSGLLIRNLEAQVDMPMIQRSQTVLTVGGTQMGASLFADDIRYPAMVAARLSFLSSPSSTFEVGTGTVVDFGSIPTYTRPFGDSVTSVYDMFKKTLIAPFADVRIPLPSSEDNQVDLYIGGAMLMLVDNDLQFRVDSFYTDQYGLSNYTAAAEVSGIQQSISYRAGVSFSRGSLLTGVFGRNYYLVRDEKISDLMKTIGEDPAVSFGIHSEVSYTRGGLQLGGYVDLRMPQVTESALGIETSYKAGNIALAAGFSTYPYDLLSQDARYYIHAAYQAGIAELIGGFYGTVQTPTAYTMEIALPLF